MTRTITVTAATLKEAIREAYRTYGMDYVYLDHEEECETLSGDVTPATLTISVEDDK